MPSQPPIWQLAPYYYPEQAAKDSPQKVIDPSSPLKSSTKLILQRGVERRLMTNDIEGAQPRSLQILKGRRHKDFFQEDVQMNQIYNRIGYQNLNNPLHHEGNDKNDFDVGKPNSVTHRPKVNQTPD
jgi:hypothetical protein